MKTTIIRNVAVLAASLVLTAQAADKPKMATQIPPEITAPLTFTANDCLDIGSDLGSPVSLAYFDEVPFKFNGTIGTTKIAYPKK